MTQGSTGGKILKTNPSHLQSRFGFMLIFLFTFFFYFDYFFIQPKEAQFEEAQLEKSQFEEGRCKESLPDETASQEHDSQVMPNEVLVANPPTFAIFFLEVISISNTLFMTVPNGCFLLFCFSEAGG